MPVIDFVIVLIPFPNIADDNKIQRIRFIKSGIIKDNLIMKTDLFLNFLTNLPVYLRARRKIARQHFQPHL